MVHNVSLQAAEAKREWLVDGVTRIFSKLDSYFGQAIQPEI